MFCAVSVPVKIKRPDTDGASTGLFIAQRWDIFYPGCFGKPEVTLVGLITQWRRLFDAMTT